MLIIGTGGLAKEIFGIILNDNSKEEITFYDQNKNCSSVLYNKYNVIKNENELLKYFSANNKEFIVGIGNPRIREKLTNFMIKLGGINSKIISKNSALFQFNNFPEGTIIEPFVGISHALEIGVGCAIHIHASIGHAAKIGKYVNVGPSATIIGPTEIGDYTYIGAKALIMPNLKIGKNVIVSAGVTVNKNLNDFETFLG